MKTILAPADQDARDRIERDLDATLFVEAGAGTGKTRELIERILQLVLSGRTELRRIAAITFTESAAAELRDRVRMRLEEAARDDELSGEEQARCVDALAEVDAAAIETLHAFAQRILTDHPLEAGLPPLIEVQDEIRSSIAFEERWAAFRDDLLEDGALEDVLLRAISLGLELKQLREIAWEFHEHWDRLERIEFPTAALAPVSVEMILRELATAIDARTDCINPSDYLYQHLERIETYRQRLAAADTDLDRLRVLSERGDLKHGRGQKGNWRCDINDVRDRLTHAHDLRETLVRDARANVLPPLLAALSRFILDYADERRRQGRLEFHDLLVQARDLLRHDASVRAAVREQFSHLLIDEFQDTDPLQIEIAVLIAGEESEAEPPEWHEAVVEEGRLFFVGDPKQSIYRFRRADIALYQRAQARFEVVRLTQNFRSLPPVIDWVNDTFAALMTAGDGQAHYVPLVASREDEGAGLTVRLLGAPSDGKVDDVREREAREIASIIQTIKSEQWPVSATDSGRARFADIALLLPTRTTLPAIEEALENAGVPYRVESQSLVYDTQEVRDLLSVLRAIDDPTDQVALIAALRSPAFGCADDDLLRYAQAKGRWDFRRDPPEALPAGDLVVEAMESLRDFHHRRWWETISGIVEAVIRERRLFELAFAVRRPRERWQRLRFVLDQARAFAEAGGRTLRQFIDWAERQADEGTRVVETVVPEPDDDAVRIMTVHAAKGLEFPIVLLAGLNVEGGSRRPRPVLWHDDGSPEVRIGADKAPFETPGFTELSDHEKEMERQEKIRLLYVAATRARDHLIVSVHQKQDDMSSSKPSHAAQLLQLALQAGDLWQPARPPAQQAPMPLPDAPPFEDSAERREMWQEERQQRIGRLSRAPRRSATEIAKATAAADPNVQKDTPAEEDPPWRRGRAGTALGRAVHAVLQSIDLVTGEDVENAARAQAAAEGIADRAEQVARTVRAALASPSIREAVAARYWRELYVSAPVDGVAVEGFIDLLYETPDGLVVVDYKTDTVPGDDDIDAAVRRYRLQGAAYALALQETLGRPVTRCVFVFAGERGARERTLDDLDGAVAEVRARLREPLAAPA